MDENELDEDRETQALSICLSKYQRALDYLFEKYSYSTGFY
jgi:hypothetical protein